MFKLGLTAALAAAALLVAASPGSGAARVTHAQPPGLVPRTGAAAGSRTAVRPAARATGFTCDGSSCSGYEGAIDQYFTDVAHDSGSSNVFSVATQYSDSTGSIAYDSTFGGAYVDTTPYPANQCDDSAQGTHDAVCLTDAELQTEIAHAISVNGWATDSTRPSHLYAIFTPTNVGICFGAGPASSGNQCSTNAFCAYHDDFSPAANVVAAYVVEPDDATIPDAGCNDGNSPNATGADATINTLSHETNEAITDPWPEATPAWLSNDGSADEIGDLCAWTFGTALGSTGNGAYNQVIDGHDYWLQEEYSNAGQGCKSSLTGPASPTTHGSGPLSYLGGPVMRTNTVYAIYWVPTTTAQVPSSTVSPVVSGLAAVGKKLSTSNGTWVGSPASFLYQWLRCSSTGINCSPIPGAQSAKYTVTKADKGHALMSQVSAKNAAATVPATSLPTDVVVDVPHLVHKPRLKGAARVGKKLTASTGRWGNIPTAFHFQWLRCSAAGRSCSRIAGARGASHKLTTKDAAHRLRIQVTAVNDAGRTKTTSAASPLVKS